MEQYGILDRDGFEPAYRIEGEGTPILVIGSSVYYPRLFSQALREKIQFIFIDQRGFARAPEAYNPLDYKLERILEDAEAVRQHLGLKKIVVLGHSGHAFLAMEYARTYPEAVQGVVLLNTAPSNTRERRAQSIAYFVETADPKRKQKFEQDFALLPDDIARSPERRFAHLMIRTAAQSFYDYQLDAAPFWEGVTTNMPIIDHLWGEVFAQIDLRERLASFEKPVLLGLGRYDYLVAPVEIWDGIEQTAHEVQKVIFEHSGHNPMYEEPERFDQLLLDWLNQVYS